MQHGPLQHLPTHAGPNSALPPSSPAHPAGLVPSTPSIDHCLFPARCSWAPTLCPNSLTQKFKVVQPLSAPSSQVSHPCVRPCVYPCVHPRLHACICPHTQPCIHPRIHPCIHSRTCVSPRTPRIRAPISPRGLGPSQDLPAPGPSSGAVSQPGEGPSQTFPNPPPPPGRPEPR